MHSIRFKITAITIAALITTILCVYGVSYATLRAENDRTSVQMMNLIGQDTKKSMEKFTEGIEQSMEMIGNIAADLLDSVTLAENGVIGSSAGTGGRTPEQSAVLDAYLAEYCAQVQEIFSGVASHTHGAITYYYCIDPAISETEHGFFHSRVGKTGFDEREPLDARELDPEDIEHTTWYYTPIQRGRPSWVGPYTAHFLEEMWIVSYLVPIYKSGSFIGVIGMDIPMETLVEQVRAIRFYDTGFACLLDENNRILYHPERDLGSMPNMSEGDSLLQQGSSGDAIVRYTVNGESRQMTFCTLSNGMKLALIAPTSEINGAWFRLGRNNLFISLAIIAVFAALITLVVRAITRPLTELTAASQRLAEADYDVDLNYKGRDEVGTLTGAFTRMRDQIKRYIEDLNRQIRTDKMTGLPNMRYFFKIGREERNRMAAEGKHPALLFFDIIGMKHFNRQHGFEEGDRLICDIADILARRFEGHSLCRFSEDHFAAVAEEEEAEEILRGILQEVPQANNGMSLPVRVGVYPDRLEQVDISVACDRAKYASDMNRGAYASSVSWFDEEMLKSGELYRYVVNSLDRALDEGWIQVYYQPIIRTSDGKVCDEEALSRWIDPVMGVLSPADFIPALEEAKLIYKLDLYVVDRVLEKMKRQAQVGLFVVPQSINLSRMDFDRCDIVEEIRRRVDAAGIDRALISIEITESVVGSDFEFMKEQVDRLRQLGFQVWMDDFGSGYSSLDVLQNIHFDLIKFDMRFMERFDEGDEGKIILTELTKMAIGLGVETVCEGVERIEQVEFLREIGCTRIQGFYYGKPLSFEQMLQKFESGADMGFENPRESEYFATIGRINLYDMSVLASGDDESLRRYFNTLPMSIIEVNGTKMKYNRCNKSYRDFLQRAFGANFSTEERDYTAIPDGQGSVFMSAVIRCGRDGNRALVDEKINDDTTVHTFVRRVAVNPVTGTAAVAAAVLAVIKDGENARMNYAQIAKALSADYVNLYYVNLNTEKYTEYSPDAAHEDLALERHGENFFASSREDAKEHLYKDDQEYFISAFTRENVEHFLDTQGAFTLTYRLLMNGVPTYVNMKAVRMQGDRSHIIIGVNNVDTQMRQKEELERIEAEKTTYSRIEALTQGFICIYTVDPITNHYVEYSATGGYAGLDLPKMGDDLFARSREESLRYVYPEDVAKFQTLFNRERMLEEIGKNGFYSFQYRMLLDGEPTYVNMKAALVEERDGPQLIIGVSNIDAQVRREQDYERKLSAARSRANLDTLTGVKNKTAYETMSETLSRQAQDGQAVQYAIALCRVRDLSRVNEEQGHEAGDQLIRDTCAVVCNVFKHSPVFRVAGDEFAVIAQGHDFENAESLVNELRDTCLDRGLAISCGLAKYDGTETVSAVFARAERHCD